jgi:hypothetical protein
MSSLRAAKGIHDVLPTTIAPGEVIEREPAIAGDGA